MRRFFVVSAAMACLSGCSCQGKSTPAPSPSESPAAARAPAPTPLAPPHAPPEPPIPERAMQLHSEGRQHGMAGRFTEAIQSFQQAQQAAPDWLFPLYDIGYTYLLMGEDAKALEAFEQVEQRAPLGFSESKRMIDCLRREKDGRVPKGTLRAYLEVLRLTDHKEVLRKLEELTRKAPAFVPAWQELAMSAEDVAEGERLVEKTLSLDPDVESRGTLLVHRAILLRRRGQEEAAQKQLQAVLDDARMPPSIHTLAREARTFLPDAPRPAAP